MNSALKQSLLDEQLTTLKPYLDRLTLTPAGRRMVVDALTGDPVRAVAGGVRNVVSRVASGKSPVTNETESRSLEFEHVWVLEADRSVLTYRTQAVVLPLRGVVPLEDGRSRKQSFQIYPDFLVVELERVVLRDLMREDELRAAADKQPWRFRRDPMTGRWVDAWAIAAVAPFGVVYEIVSSAEHSALLARNCRYLADFAKENVSPSVRDALVAAVSTNPGTTVSELVETGRAAGRTVDDVLAAIAQGDLYCDLTKHVVDDQFHARVYANAATAQAYATAHAPSWAIAAAPRERLSLLPGARYTLGPSTLEVFTVTSSGVLLEDSSTPQRTVREFAREHLENLLAAGTLVPIGIDDAAAAARRAAHERWSTARPGDRAIALARSRALEMHHDNIVRRRVGQPEQSLPLVDGVIPSQRTLERWERARKQSERLYGDSLTGLLPEVRLGRPGDRLLPAVEDIVDARTHTYYTQPAARNLTALCRVIAADCVGAGLPVPDRRSVKRRVQRHDQYRQRRRREGDKNAYADKPYLPVDPDGTPVDGIYPFQVGHLDFTVADVEIIDPLSGRPLGRPTIGELVDAYSGKTVARVFTWGHPTAYDVTELIRRCVERYGRCFEEIVLDNAVEHKATSVQVLKAAYRITLTYRPAAQSRFGAPVELAFARSADMLVHQLFGNTRLMRAVRSVTDAVSARKLATLSLIDLDGLFDAFDRVCDGRVVKRLGMTVGQAFDAGLVAHGARTSRSIQLDAAFTAMTLRPDGRRKAKGVGGVFVHYLPYRHACFCCGQIKNTFVDVAIDPLDASYVMVFVPAHYHGPTRIAGSWVRAESDLLAKTRVASWSELNLISKAIRERLSDDAKQTRLRQADIGEMLIEATESEKLAVARLQAESARRLRGPLFKAASPGEPANEPQPATQYVGVAASGSAPDALDAFAGDLDDTYFRTPEEAA